MLFFNILIVYVIERKQEKVEPQYKEKDKQVLKGTKKSDITKGQTLVSLGKMVVSIVSVLYERGIEIVIIGMRNEL